MTPIKLILKDETGNPKEIYVLEFSRESVLFTNKMGFKVSEINDNPEGMIPLLFFGAFRKNHKGLSRQQTDDILFNKLHGLTEAAVERLLLLYGEPRKALIVDNEDAEKNVCATVEL